MCGSHKQGASIDAGRRPLGINTKSSSPSNAEKNTRRERYELLRTARRIYAYKGKREGLEYVLNYHKTAKCKHVLIADGVDVLKSKEHSKAFYKGLTVCGRIWTCPVCSALIQERRRHEVSAAMDYFYAQPNKQAAMVTLTFSHSFGDDLSTLLAQQSKALTKLRSGKAWEKFKAVFGFEGLIRSLELTFGDNGYHPHTHELWFIDKRINRARLNAYLDAKYRAKKHHARRDELKAMTPQKCFIALLLERWEACCAKVGLLGDKVDVFRKRAVDVKFNAKNSDYLAKQDSSSHWGADREIAKASTKQGRKKGMHPFMFLQKYEETGDTIWAYRWLEYTKAMHLKAQMYWSAGLKELVGIADKDDEEIAVEMDDQADHVAKLNKQQWRKVANNGKAWLILDVAEVATEKAVLAVVDNLPDAPSVEESIENVQPEFKEFWCKKGKDLVSDELVEDLVKDLERYRRKRA
ncbi:hypothetical protein AKH06_18080 [Vibrio parahaemolyticus]|nr:hypothetical protein AKH06_18080 [Vibrio parahaemolyticus]